MKLSHFFILLIAFVLQSAHADIYLEHCSSPPVYGGQAGCYASIPVPNWPTKYLQGNFPAQSNSSVRLSAEVRDNCVGTAGCPAFHYSCTANLPRIGCQKTLVDLSLCQIPVQNRVNAGFSGISAEECKSRDMCWDSGSSNGVKCYLPTPSPLTRQYYKISIKSGVNSNKTLLSVPIHGGFADLWNVNDMSGRQEWYITPSPDGSSFNIIVKTGVNNSKKYLSVNNDGTKVDLHHTDDGSGRQRWVFFGENILVKDGVSGGRRYLSTNIDGSKVDLWSQDDGSGRQKWIREAIPK
jgi:hypothetical protein